MSDIDICPRCGSQSVEHLKTHSFCHQCGFSPDFDPELAPWEQLEGTIFQEFLTAQYEIRQELNF